jgi:predicted component of type VI protein secretion system
MKMQDLRERLLRHQTQPNSEAKYAISQIWPTAEGGSKSKEDGVSVMRSQEPNAKVGPQADSQTNSTQATPQPPAGREALAAVTALFQFAEGFENRVRDLVKVLQPLESLSHSTVNELAPLAEFRSQIEKLAGTLEPMKAFYDQLLNLAKDFPPMRSLYEQVVKIPEEFQVQLTHLAETLAPAKSFRQRIEELAKSFEPIDALEDQFLKLAEAFGQVVGEKTVSNGNGGGGATSERGSSSQAENGMEMSTGRPGPGGKSAWVMG